MSFVEVAALMNGKDDLARSVIAQRVGERLSSPAPLDDVERRAAEALAKLLAHDAAERVRSELAKSIRNAKYLPRDIALKIAHDIDSVACPFLEVTEVFSESDWQQLVLTISRSARVAVARRSTMSESLALTLAELGDLAVAETLVDNRATPMTKLVCGTLIDRFETEVSLLDKMAYRDDLLIDVVVRLTIKVSSAAREKLLSSYRMADYTEVIGAEAEAGTLLGIIRETPASGMTALARALRREAKLTDYLLLSAAGENLVEFVVAALSDRTGNRVEQVRGILLHADRRNVIGVLKQAKIPDVLHDGLWSALTFARGKEGKLS
jgi:uncharacterized protein (DUF2336 family)